MKTDKGITTDRAKGKPPPPPSLQTWLVLEANNYLKNLLNNDQSLPIWDFSWNTAAKIGVWISCLSFPNPLLFPLRKY